MFAFADEIPRHRENKIATVHSLAKAHQSFISQAGIVTLQSFRPAVEHLAKGLAVFMQSDWILKHRGADPIRRFLDQAQAIGRADTSAQRVATRDPEMVEQCDMVGSICMPAVGGADRTP